jgi:hypothetical protein
VSGDRRAALAALARTGFAALLGGLLLGPLWASILWHFGASSTRPGSWVVPLILDGVVLLISGGIDPGPDVVGRNPVSTTILRARHWFGRALRWAVLLATVCYLPLVLAIVHITTGATP